jgi:hypothetical protein
MPQTATPADADVIMRLYDLRREEKMRKARSWFMAYFKGITNMDALTRLAPAGSDENAYFRMVVSYWDMAAGFANSGAVNKDLFFRSSNEMLFVWLRASEVIPQLRQARNNSLAYADLEEGAMQMADWLEARAPGAFDGFRKMVLGS